MTYVMAIQKIGDYQKWKQVFDEHGSVRKDRGSKGAIIYQSSNNPDELVIITEWQSLEAAKNFSKAERSKIAMKKAGVNGLPELHYLEELEKTEY